MDCRVPEKKAAELRGRWTVSDTLWQFFVDLVMSTVLYSDSDSDTFNAKSFKHDDFSVEIFL